MNGKLNNILRGGIIKVDGIILKHLLVEEFYQEQIQSNSLTVLSAYLPSSGSNFRAFGEIDSHSWVISCLTGTLLTIFEWKKYEIIIPRRFL